MDTADRERELRERRAKLVAERDAGKAKQDALASLLPDGGNPWAQTKLGDSSPPPPSDPERDNPFNPANPPLPGSPFGPPDTSQRPQGSEPWGPQDPLLEVRVKLANAKYQTQIAQRKLDDVDAELQQLTPAVVLYPGDTDFSLPGDPAQPVGTSDAPAPAPTQPDDGDVQFTVPTSPPPVSITVADSPDPDSPGYSTSSVDLTGPQFTTPARTPAPTQTDPAAGDGPPISGDTGDGPSPGFFSSHRGPIVATAGAVIIIGAVLGGVLGTGGGNSPTTPTTPPTTSSTGHTSGSGGTTQAAYLPATTDTALGFAAVATPGGSSTFTEVLQQGTAPGQFVERSSYPSTNSAQAATETFSSSGVVITALQTSAPSGTADYTFATPLPVILAPYTVGHRWDVTSTGTSSTGSDTVHVTDGIAGFTNMSLAGHKTVRVIVVDIDHVITESTPSGTIASQTSTGTEYFAPSLGVFVSGKSTEVTQGTTVTNQFNLSSIGVKLPSGSSATGTPGASGSAPTGSSSATGATQGATGSGPPVITRQPANATCPRHGNASFSVTATGAQPLSYRWQQEVGDTATFNDIPGATAMGWSQECLANARLRVIVSNPVGTTTSYVVDLTVQ
jgi:hypothetical protein